jgi:hypothetical protein
VRVAAAALIVVAACSSGSTPEAATPATTTEAVAPTFAPAGPPATFAPLTTDVTTAQLAVPSTIGPLPPPSAVVGVGELGLRVEPEPARVGYDRGLFEHWVDEDGNGCDTRQEVLRRESLTAAQVDPFGCLVLVGDWVSYLDGYSTEDPGELDVDHTVALAEAWDSGAWAWDAGRRRAFANDLDTPGALRAVTASENARKSDRDPAGYQPAMAAANCEFATSWVAVKQRWDLSVDAAEEAALANLLAAC